MRKVWRKTLATVGIAVALAVGPGIGMANAAPTQIQPAQVAPPPGELLPPIPEAPALPALGLGAELGLEAAVELLLG
jgi:hypothetical protein